MKISTISALVASGMMAALSAGNAIAQTCDSPLPLTSNTALSGTTCGGQTGIDLGGVPLVHPAVVHSFVAQGASGTIDTSGDATISALLTTDCSEAPSDAGNSISLDGLVDGTTYLLIVTSENLSAPDPQICGAYTVSPDTLPVELQSFTVD